MNLATGHSLWSRFSRMQLLDIKGFMHVLKDTANNGERYAFDLQQWIVQLLLVGKGGKLPQRE